MPDLKNTKQLLAQSLKTLMACQPFAKISVGDICAQCGMSRKSFYYHFQDKYDLMNWIFFTEFIGNIHFPNQPDGWQLLQDICSYFYREQVFYRNALSVNGQNSFQEYFVETIEPFILALVSDLFSESDEVQFYVTFYTDALLSALIRWLNEGAQIPPDRFAELLRNALSIPNASPPAP